MAGTPGDHDRAVPGWRPCGYCRARRRQCAERNPRQAVHYRQPRGSRRQHWGAAVAKASADGYTLLFTTPAPAALNKFMYKSLPYDPERDLAPVVIVAKSPLIVTAKLDFPAKTLAELIAYAKQNPGNVNVGHPGNGTLGHITSELIQQFTGVKMTNVPYRGTAPLTTDLLAGQIDVAMDFMPTYVPLVADRKIRALAVTTSQRTPQLPDVPTVQEAGYKGFEATAWYAIVAPTSTPQDIVSKVNNAVNAFLASDKGKTSSRRTPCRVSEVLRRTSRHLSPLS
jgi:tripartite-type tricarboxylate transporter receptor subunit TctC